jgi:hypothetical protein
MRWKDASRSQFFSLSEKESKKRTIFLFLFSLTTKSKKSFNLHIQRDIDIFWSTKIANFNKTLEETPLKRNKRPPKFTFDFAKKAMCFQRSVTLPVCLQKVHVKPAMKTLTYKGIEEQQTVCNITVSTMAGRERERERKREERPFRKTKRKREISCVGSPK